MVGFEGYVNAFTARAFAGPSPDSIRKRKSLCDFLNMAGETGLEPAADGFGDRYSTNCATPLNVSLSRTAKGISALIAKETSAYACRRNLYIIQ